MSFAATSADGSREAGSVATATVAGALLAAVEMHPERSGPTPGAYHPQHTAEAKTELVPVPASVFDDDFFQKGNEELRASQRDWPGGGPNSASSAAAEVHNPATWPEVRVPSFAGYTGDAQQPAPESDELDIPAFLRRSH